MVVETKEVKVLHFYNHPIYYSFMPQKIFEILEEAFLNDQETAIVPKRAFEAMVNEYLDTLKN